MARFRYCSNLPSDAFANLTPLASVTQNSDEKGSYECALTLPINAPLKQSVPVGQICNIHGFRIHQL